MLFLYIYGRLKYRLDNIFFILSTPTFLILFVSYQHLVNEKKNIAKKKNCTKINFFTFKLYLHNYLLDNYFIRTYQFVVKIVPLRTEYFM